MTPKDSGNPGKDENAHGWIKSDALAPRTKQPSASPVVDESVAGEEDPGSSLDIADQPKSPI